MNRYFSAFSLSTMLLASPLRAHGPAVLESDSVLIPSCTAFKEAKDRFEASNESYARVLSSGYLSVVSGDATPEALAPGLAAAAEHIKTGYVDMETSLARCTEEILTRAQKEAQKQK